MRQASHCCHQVVLDVAEVHKQVAFWEYGAFILCFAAFNECIEDIMLSIGTTDQLSDLLAKAVDPRDEQLEVVGSSDEYQVFDGFGLPLG